jgi:hypothetical protein
MACDVIIRFYNQIYKLFIAHISITLPVSSASLCHGGKRGKLVAPKFNISVLFRLLFEVFGHTFSSSPLNRPMYVCILFTIKSLEIYIQTCIIFSMIECLVVVSPFLATPMCPFCFLLAWEWVRRRQKGTFERLHKRQKESKKRESIFGWDLYFVKRMIQW